MKDVHYTSGTFVLIVQQPDKIPCILHKILELVGFWAVCQCNIAFSVEHVQVCFLSFLSMIIFLGSGHFNKGIKKNNNCTTKTKQLCYFLKEHFLKKSEAENSQNF